MEDLAVSFTRAQPVLAGAAGTDHEFTDAERVGLSERILRGEALVVMVMAVDYDLGIVLVENIPKVVQRAAFGQASSEARVMENCQAARIGVGFQIRFQPGELRTLWLQLIRLQLLLSTTICQLPAS